MNRNILNQAFITMGYRQMSSHNLGNIYGKPVGFGIVIAKIDQNHKEITLKEAIERFFKGCIYDGIGENNICHIHYDFEELEVWLGDELTEITD